MKNIIEKYKHNVKAIIKNLTGSSNEDLEQEVYFRTWKNLNKYHEKGSFIQWINTITSNICKDYLKSSNNKISQKTIALEEKFDTSSDKDNVENIFEIKQRRITVSQAILSLKPKLREVIVLYEIEGINYEQISQKIKCPVGTVKSRIFKARQELYKILKDIL